MSTTATIATCCNPNDPTLFKLLSQGVSWFLFDLLSLSSTSHTGQFLHYFLYTSTKIFLLLLTLMYLVGLFRAGMNVEKVRRFLIGKHKLVAYFLAALFGAVTPFCSCAAVPIFIAFTASGIPLGITIAFLVTSPIINEIGIVLLLTEMGAGFATLYVVLGMMSGIISGFLFDLFAKENFLRDDVVKQEDAMAIASKDKGILTLQMRHTFSVNEMKKILFKVSPWIALGVAIAGLLNLLITPESVSALLNRQELFSVPVAVLIGIPLYSSPAGVVPIGTVLLKNSVPVGTVLAFMMSCTAASFPEFILLRRVLTTKGIFFLFALLLSLFTLIGIFLNLVR